MAGREVAFGGGGAPNHTKKLKISSRDDSIFSSAPSNSFTGSRAMVSFGAVGGVNGSGNSFYQSFDSQENGDEYFDDYFNQPEKKKRLSFDQVQFLEKSFELENKLEPERKTQLANELGLQPRQIAVWFQNRRARWKTKQTETEYETLHASYKSLKTDYDSLLKENEKLKAQVFHLKHNGLAQDTENVSSRLCGTRESSEATPNKALADMLSIGGESTAPATSSKNDEQNSAKSDVTNADSPGLVDGTHPLLVESGDSSHVFDMDLSHNEEDCLNEELLQHAYLYPNVNSCGYGFTVEDHAFGFWSC